MSERNEHLFQFPASEIAEAAEREAEYHAKRLAYWEKELEEATERVRETAAVKVERQEVTGGWRPHVSVDYGDQAAYQRMNEAAEKIQTHRKARDRFESDATLYATQGDRTYELDPEDVAHFRLNGRPRDA